jgi:Plavaka transposase
MAIANDYEDLDLSLAQRRGRREHRQLPKRYRDVLPEPPAALPLMSTQIGTVTSPPISAVPALPQALSTILPPVRMILKSTSNVFGLFRQYHATSFPDHDPNENIVSDDLIDSSPDSHPVETYHPYPNQSSFLLGRWYWNGGVQKSQSSFQHLLKIIGHPEFRPEDVAGLNWHSIDAQLSGDRPFDSLNGEGSWQDERADGDWVRTPITIKVPFHKRMLHPGEKVFDAGILHHRKLVSVIRERITSTSTHPHLHFEPYGLYWQPKESSEPVRVHGELYTSEAFIEAHHELQSATREPGCDLARVVVGLMFASDGTQLANFSNAKLSPVYLGFGNESKDRRSKPSCQAFEHIAYFETVSMVFFFFKFACGLNPPARQLPDAFKAFAKNFIGEKGPDSILMAHCHREMYHAQWAIILDDEFLEAYQHGIVISCLDGVKRRFYPRIFTYSADYPEK